MNSPFFIVGASRSGTTMLRLMLNAHSRLAVPDELGYFRHVEGKHDLGEWDTPLSETDVRALVQGFVEKNAESLGGGRADLEAVALAGADRTLRGPFQALLEDWARRSGTERWGEKTPHNIFYVDVIAGMFPEAQFIHVVRDPRAVVQSMNSSPYYSDETVFNALNWRKSIREGERLLNAHLRPERQQTVRYEDLVCHAESTLRSVCSFLGEAFEPKMLRFYETADQHMAGPIRTPSIKGPVNQKGLSKWRRRLRPSDVAAIEGLCREEMNALGYEGTGTPSVRLRLLPRVLYWKWKAWKHRNRRGFEVGFPFLAGLSSLTRSPNSPVSTHDDP